MSDSNCDVSSDDSICYLNTDLDLTSVYDLTALAGVFRAQGAFVLHLTRGDDQLWYATIEVLRGCQESRNPESDIAFLLRAVESLPESLQTEWTRCSRREFNIGYDCGSKPW